MAFSRPDSNRSAGTSLWRSAASVCATGRELRPFGVAGQAFSSLTSNCEATNQDTRNFERYQRTWETLQELRKRLDEVRVATAKGDTEAMQELWRPFTNSSRSSTDNGSKAGNRSVRLLPG